MMMSQEQRDASRAKRMAELKDQIPNTLRCVEVLQQHAPTLKYVRPCALEDTLTAIAKGENVCPDTLFTIYKADYCCPDDFPETK